LNSESLCRVALLSLFCATAPWQASAQTLHIVANPSTVNLGGSSGAAASVSLTRSDNALTSSFTAIYDNIMGVGGPWAILEAPGSTPGTACTACVVPGTFTVRLMADRVPTGVTSGWIVLGGTGLQPRQLFVNLPGSGSTGTVFATPNVLTFNQSGTGSITFASTTGTMPNYTVGLTGATNGSWVTVSPAPNTGTTYGPNNNPAFSVTVNPAGLSAGTHTANLSLTPTTSFSPTVSVPITLTVATGGTGNFLSVSPNPVTMTGTEAVPVTITLSGIAAGAQVPYTIDLQPRTVVGYAADPPVYLTNGGKIWLVPTTSGFGTATLTLTPTPSTGVNAVTVPITVNPSGASRFLTANPNQVNLNSFTTTTNVSVTPSVNEAVPYTLLLSQNLQTLVNNGWLSIIGPTIQIPGTGGTFTFTLLAPSSVPAGLSGTLTIQPSSNYGAVNIPVTVNGGGTGAGTLTVNPFSLAFNGAIGGTQPATQTLSITSSDFFTSQYFFATATSSGNWLTVTPQSGITPTTLNVSVNPNALTAAGTYQGSITVTPQTGIGAGFPVNIPVTLNLTQSFTITANPTPLSLTGAAGSSAVSTTVQVTPSTGNPSFSTTVTTDIGSGWLSAVSSTSTLPASVIVTANPVGLSQGTYTGSVAIVSGGVTVGTIPVTLTVGASATLQVTPAVMTFTHQTTGSANPPSQTVQITSTGTTANWTASSTANWLTVTPQSGVTPGAVAVGVNPAGLSAGTYNGTVTVSSSGVTNSPRTINVTLTVTTPALPQITSLQNSASLSPTVAVPGLIFSIFGTDLGPATGVSGQPSGVQLGTTLGEVRVLFDGIAAPLLYVSANQINGVMPFELAGRFSTRMQVEYRGQRSREIELRVAEASPAIFTEGARGFGQGAVLNQNNTVNGPNNAEARGNVVVIYATGGGLTSPLAVTGQVATSSGSLVAAPVRVLIGGVEAQVLYAGPAPGLISGAIQINAVVPQSAATGTAVPVTVHVGSGMSQGNVTIAVR